MKHGAAILSKKTVVALTAVLLFAVTGCTKSEQVSHGASKPDMIEAIAGEKEAAKQEQATEAETEELPVITAPALNAPSEIREDAHLDPLPESDVDVDLTKMSGTVVYARVLNLLTHPETYVGMTVRMNGAFSLYINEETDAHYYACIIQDATACCAQGIEFVRNGNYVYPEDYPEEGDDIVVEGTFEIYEEEGFRYIHLVDADMRPDDGSEAVNG